jgi:hypothetical protein
MIEEGASQIEGIGIEEFENSDVRYSVRKRKGFPLIL